MTTAYRLLFPALWLSWVAYWIWASRSTKPTERREPVASRLLHVLPLMLAAWLLWSNRVPIPFLAERLFPRAPWQFWVGAVLTAAGLLFTVWARSGLAANWSGIVTLKQGHELVDTGPYALVRHPIYTGLLAAFVGSAIARGDWRGILAVVIAWAALWRKLRLEERWMTERFGERYHAYRERVPALVPFLKSKPRAKGPPSSG
ncbi:MAG TPA: isoprenylcysteine carboxylmethyltransferase family protein [Usitatibacter sp.]|nr:isoprenylcysteine carboxylmethyltransferase family protein [Usitatibacter sp.]